MPTSIWKGSISFGLLNILVTLEKAEEGPKAFTMKNGLRKLKLRKSDPWKGMLGLKQKISLLK